MKQEYVEAEIELLVFSDDVVRCSGSGNETDPLPWP